MQDFTTGPVSRHLLKTTGFMLVTMLFQTLYFLVDLYWVGRLGKESVAALSVAGNLMFWVLALSQMLGVGTTTLISHAVGRREREHAGEVFNQALVLSVLVGALFLVAAMVLRRGYAGALSADAETARLAVEYLGWFVPALSLQFLVVAMVSAMRGSGNFKPGMLVQSATVLLNMVLAPFLIFGWGTNRPFGVAGAALATFISIALGTVWLTWFFLPKDAFLRLAPAQWRRPRFDLWSRMLKIGLPAGAEFALMGVYLLIVYTISRPFGAAAQAGFGIGLRVVQAGFMPVVALGFAVAPVAGQNYGARHPERVIAAFRAAAIGAGGVMLVFAVICHVANAQMIGVFSSDPAVMAVGDEYLRILSWSFVASGVVFVCASTFQAIGNTIPSLVASATRIVVVAVPSFLVARLPGFQLRWIWYLAVGSIALQTVLSLLLLRREFRRRLSFAPAVVRSQTVDTEAPAPAAAVPVTAVGAGAPIDSD